MSAIYFEIQADDVKRASGFYTAVFGWKLSEVEGLSIPYWHIETGSGSEGGLLKRPAERPPAQCGTNAFVCSFEVNDFDRKSAKILSLGGVVAVQKFCVPRKCWQGYFLDTEGNTFGIFEVDEKAGR
jgi:uncharacterized protein